jgi:hypothetical protein
MSSVVVSVPFRSRLDAFCSANKVSPLSIAKLAFAIVLHQYFDLSEFTCVETPSNDHDDHKIYPIDEGRQIQFHPELASTTTIRAALHLGELDLPSDGDLTPLLVNQAATANLDDALFVKNLKASPVFGTGNPDLAKASWFSAAADQVSDVRIFIPSCALLT